MSVGERPPWSSKKYKNYNEFNKAVLAWKAKQPNPKKPKIGDRKTIPRRREKGGWTKRDNIDYFLEYAHLLSKEYGDQVKNWITHNEPWVISHLGFAIGTHAPGLKSFSDYIKVNHHLLLSHGLAIPIIRQNSSKSDVGIVLNLTPGYAESMSPEDDREKLLFNQWFNEWFLDPLYGNKYPKEIKDKWIKDGDFPKDIDFIKSNDFKVISTKTDFLGINYYFRYSGLCSQTCYSLKFIILRFFLIWH